ncbi:carbon-nitrogen hydrolase family protein [Photobacterium ganghwense]|uniref:carbon-nitrogen hydrolase family protein n=1 Tax=Photobacterium ganghwense TaxID=320778 RepID=UPI001A8C46FD|nr:carbon-nitrogen hydrolase family protein [Photobacterium ganghwense]QSV17460.1 carbon-nitrogen hydrolase family protein [Photobacterium ganghwense]
MKTGIRISLAQIPVVKGNVVANLSNHLTMIAQSSLYGANVVVFPELSLTGYELELAQELAFSPQSPHFSTLSRASIENDIVVIAGCPLNIKNSAKPTIGAVICFPDGTIEFYSKQYLHEGEGTFCASGSEDYVFNVEGYRIGLAICADFSSTAHSLNARMLGADAYIASALISDSGFEADTKILSNIASKHRFPVLLSNHISSTGGWSACGNNTIWNASGDVVLSSASKEHCLVMCSINGHEVYAAQVQQIT